MIQIRREKRYLQYHIARLLISIWMISALHECEMEWNGVEEWKRHQQQRRRWRLWSMLVQHKWPVIHLCRCASHHCKLCTHSIRMANVFIILQRLRLTTQLVFNHPTKCEHFANSHCVCTSNKWKCARLSCILRHVLRYLYSVFLYFQQTDLAIFFTSRGMCYIVENYFDCFRIISAIPDTKTIRHQRG